MVINPSVATARILPKAHRPSSCSIPDAYSRMPSWTKSRDPSSASKATPKKASSSQLSDQMEFLNVMMQLHFHVGPTALSSRVQ
jgi:hypothetical protein